MKLTGSVNNLSDRGNNFSAIIENFDDRLNNVSERGLKSAAKAIKCSFRVNKFTARSLTGRAERIYNTCPLIEQITQTLQ